jgi:dihydroxyacetone kinase-like predicted kinase
MPEKFMLTVFVGADATEEERAELEAFVAEKYPDDEIYFINGGQDIYPFIFVAE